MESIRNTFSRLVNPEVKIFSSKEIVCFTRKNIANEFSYELTEGEREQIIGKFVDTLRISPPEGKSGYSEWLLSSSGSKEAKIRGMFIECTRKIGSSPIEFRITELKVDDGYDDSEFKVSFSDGK
jgi:hypothetical protein